MIGVGVGGVYFIELLELFFPVVVCEGGAKEDDLRSDDVCARQIVLSPAFRLH
jgi:hypothetical protein